jgi:hypothetical protein
MAVRMKSKGKISVGRLKTWQMDQVRVDMERREKTLTEITSLKPWEDTQV